MLPRLASAASLSLLLALAACKRDKEGDAAVENAGTLAGILASKRLTVTQRTVVFPGTDTKAKSIAVLQVGEPLEFLGDSAESPEAKGESLYKVKLSDGSEGWVRNYGVVFGAPAALLADVQVFQRPTQLAPSKTMLRLGQIVGRQEDGPEGFVHVVVNRWQQGWVAKEAVSTATPDVLAGARVTAAMGKKTGLEAAQAGLAVLQDHASAVAQALQARLDSAAAESMEETAEDAVPDVGCPEGAECGSGPMPVGAGSQEAAPPAQ